ncbi:MAG TPA: MBL fold metallo-hydrolase [Candidatus Caldiarchaeum subterraneum]|uniref:MBL fold metallo-hydrolase n=1 Tax=Caldiarchaeum subterraneum TaxID=311458 RepID=A0A833EAZ9_CALS0|nr:MBL fold metallo-hydrolase [Candidatus Caldarchaeum subterraneum]
MPYDFKGIQISWLGHDGFRITYGGKVVYIDPYQIKGGPQADLILITHDHFDHLSIDDIKKVAGDKTVVIAAENCSGKVKNVKAKEVRLVKPGEKTTVGDITVEAIHAYNVNKFRSPGVVFHPKEYNGVGYVVSIGGVRIYHAGDTDNIPEMRELKPDVALLPVSGTYVMTAEEAAEAVESIKPKVAIPMHYGAIVGTEADAERFRSLAKCEVAILRKEE